MSKQELTQDLTKKEIEKLKDGFGSKKEIKAFAEDLAMLIRAFDGRAIDPDDVITRLINVKHPWERSIYPTFPILQKQVYLRLIAKFAPEATAMESWADIEANCLPGYKGKNWDSYVEMVKAATHTSEDSTQFYFGDQLQQPQERKSRFSIRRKPKTKETEFPEQ